MKLTFLGTGAGETYPGYWCECPLRLPLPHTGLNRFLCIPVPAARLPLSLRSEYR